MDIRNKLAEAGYAIVDSLELNTPVDDGRIVYVVSTKKVGVVGSLIPAGLIASHEPMMPFDITEIGLEDVPQHRFIESPREFVLSELPDPVYENTGPRKHVSKNSKYRTSVAANKRIQKKKKNRKK